MDDFVVTADDHGGVHINSGIPNHAFFLAATALGGNAWEVAGRIWFETLATPSLDPGQVTPLATFAQFATATLATAESLYGQGSTEATAILDGWKGVGVDAFDLEEQVG
jgi:Zn-dependent metalloprotease